MRGRGSGATVVVTWPERAAHWRRFAVWEAEHLRATPYDFSRALTWFADAWSLAERYDPSWASAAHAEEHRRHLGEVRAALARMRSQP